MSSFTPKKQASELPTGHSAEPANGSPGGPSGQPPESPPQERSPAALDIAFIRDDFPEYDTIPAHVERAKLYLSYSIAAIVISVSGIVGLATQALSLGSSDFLVIASVLLVLVLVALARWDFRSTFDRGEAIHRLLPFESLKAGRRVQICVRPRRALEIWRSLPKADTGFEPEIARAPLALGLDARTRRLAFLGGLIGIACAALGLTVYGWDRVHLAVMFWFAMGMLTLGSVAIPEFFFPTYIRVIPGRLDVIRAPLLGSSMHTLASIDLRERPLVISDVALFAEPQRPPGTPRPDKVWSKRWSQGMVYPPECNPEAVSLMLCFARKRLIRAIVHAAVTRAPTPEIPSDRLLG